MAERSSVRYEEVLGKLELMLLDPVLTETETIRACEFVKQHPIASVCVKPCYVRAAVTTLRGTGIPVSTVVGFPYGGNTTEIKKAETARALTEGATEIEAVINLGDLHGGREKLIREELSVVGGLAHMNNALIKVVLETAYLTHDQIRLGSHIAVDAGMDFISISPGSASQKVIIEDLAVIRDSMGERIKLKASGNINTIRKFLIFWDAGCSRIGTPSIKEIHEKLLSK